MNPIKYFHISSFKLLWAFCLFLLPASVIAFPIVHIPPTSWILPNSTQNSLGGGPVVNITISGPAIFADFNTQTNYGLTLAQTATSHGYDHFNWLQVVTNGSHSITLPDGTTAPFPHIDPPIGGSLNRWADNQPFYWEEVFSPMSPHWQPGYDITDHTYTDYLHFEDQPSGPFTGSEFKHFQTMLVGVRSSINWDILYMFGWNTNFNSRTGTGGVYEILISDAPAATADSSGGIFGLRENMALEELSDPVKRLLLDLGAKNIPTSVPEPTVLGLLIIGVLAFISIYNKSYRY